MTLLVSLFDKQHELRTAGDLAMINQLLQRFAFFKIIEANSEVMRGLIKWGRVVKVPEFSYVCQENTALEFLVVGLVGVFGKVGEEFDEEIQEEKGC
jgi:hypothetical protein